MVTLEVFTRSGHRLVQPAERRTAIPGNEPRGVQAGPRVPLALQQREAHERLNAGQIDAATVEGVFLVQGDVRERRTGTVGFGNGGHAVSSSFSLSITRSRVWRGRHRSPRRGILFRADEYRRRGRPILPAGIPRRPGRISGTSCGSARHRREHPDGGCGFWRTGGDDFSIDLGARRGVLLPGGRVALLVADVGRRPGHARGTGAGGAP